MSDTPTEGEKQAAEQPAPDTLLLKAPAKVPATIGNDESQRDSPLLPTSRVNLIDDGILDQQSRRSHRPVIVAASICILICFVINLTWVVGVMGVAFLRALEPDAVGKSAAAHLVKHIDEAASAPAMAMAGKTEAKKPAEAVAKTKAEKAQEIKVEAKIYGEVRDSMIPLVALVSILTVAIVVILGTFLKAAFLGHPNGQTEEKPSDPSPVPVIEAIKGLVESIKALFKS